MTFIFPFAITDTKNKAINKPKEERPTNKYAQKILNNGIKIETSQVVIFFIFHLESSQDKESDKLYITY